MNGKSLLHNVILSAAVVLGTALAMSPSDADARNRCRRGGSYYRAPARVSVGYAPRYYGGYRGVYGGPRYYGGGWGGGWGGPGWGYGPGWGGGGVAIGRGGIAVGW